MFQRDGFASRRRAHTESVYNDRLLLYQLILLLSGVPLALTAQPPSINISFRKEHTLCQQTMLRFRIGTHVVSGRRFGKPLRSPREAHTESVYNDSLWLYQLILLLSGMLLALTAQPPSINISFHEEHTLCQHTMLRFRIRAHVVSGRRFGKP